MKFGLYTHIPFCQAKCSYCHFVSFPYREKTAARYRNSILKEIAGFTVSEQPMQVDTIYFGGGTPSLIPENHIGEILAAFRRRFLVSEPCEITLEANPGTLSAGKIKAYKEFGVNRISLGAQSCIDSELRSIGRMHTWSLVHETVQALRSGGFSNLSIDLMLGLPAQTEKSWRASLDAFVRLDIEHISVYMLDLDDKCPLSDLLAEGLIAVPEDDRIADMYLETIDLLARYGYGQYEISNFARPDFACRHNLKYWMRDPFLGFGLASHSFDGKSRYANGINLEEYCAAVANGKSPAAWQELIGASKAIQETLFLGLRMTDGINIQKFCEEFGEETVSRHLENLRNMPNRDLIRFDDGHIRLSPSGMLVSNEIFQHLV